MKRLCIYRHPECEKCARIGRVHKFLDWMNRLEISTLTPSTGPLRKGQIVVEELGTNRMLHGAEALAAICRNVPIYLPVLLLLRIPAFRLRIDRELSGCDDGSCDVKTEKLSRCACGVTPLRFPQSRPSRSHRIR